MNQLNKTIVTFTHRNGESISIDLVSKFTCIIGDNSGEGKTEFFTMLLERNRNHLINIVADYNVLTIDGDDALSAVLNNDDISIIILDEYAMYDVHYIKLMQKSKHLFICISRGFPKTIQCPYHGIYRLERTPNWFRVFRDNRLHIGVTHDSYDLIVTESHTNRSEHELLSPYLGNLYPCNSRDNIYRKTRKLSGKILILADLGNIGPAYKNLVKLCCNNTDIDFYNYQCFEELLFCSKLVQSLEEDVVDSNLNYNTIEQYYEKILEKRTYGTKLEYKHGKPLARPFLEVENFKDVFDSDVGRELMDYITKNTKVNLGIVDVNNMDLF